MWAPTLDVTTAVAVVEDAAAVAEAVVGVVAVVVAVVAGVTIGRAEVTDRDAPSRVSPLPAAVHRQTQRLRPSASACVGASVAAKAPAASPGLASRS